MRAFLNLRFTLPSRCAAYEAGLKRLGYSVTHGITMTPEPGDILVTWNRIRAGDEAARVFERHDLPVLVAENAAWGNGFNGQKWNSLARTFHNQSGRFPIGGNERWDSLGVDLMPWRTSGETVVLPQRGIGPREVAMPRSWRAAGRVRGHPGKDEGIPLQQDLARAGKVVTWGSGAAVKALLWGIPVESHMPNWIAEQDNTDEGRLAMFRRLAWAQWTLEEIEIGTPFSRLIGHSV
jgi:hypothetical protein